MIFARFRLPVLGVSLLLSAATGVVCAEIAEAQAPAAAPAPARQIGTVKEISGSNITLKTDAGQQVVVSVADAARILQLAPGSTDLKTAQSATLAEIGVGDRVLVTGKAGDDASTFTASRVILMKSGDVAQKNQMEQADWQKRGAGGLVTAVDAGTITVSAGAKKMQVQTSGTTKFRRYAADSVKFEDTKQGTLSQIQVGDQLRVRGNKSEDGLSIQAEDIVSGSFRNLAGTIASINAANSSVTLKDLATKKTMTVKVTANSDMRKLPPTAAMMFAARARGGAGASGGASGSPAAGQAPAAQSPAPGQGGGQPGASGYRTAGGPGAGGGAGRAGMDLSQMLSRLPTETVADLKVGDAVMIVASEPEPGSANVTAMTLLSGVEPILAATPTGTPAMTLSPWSVGGAAPEGVSQ